MKNIFTFAGILLIAFTIGCQTPSNPTTQNNSTQSASTQPPQIKATGLGCEDKYCIWITGSNFPANSVVELRKVSDSGQPLAKYTELVVNTQGADQVITIAVKEPEARAAMSNPGVKVKIINPANNSSAESEAIVRTVK